jgi:hypothetical protein
MLRPRKGWHYGILALLAGILLTTSTYLADVGTSLFFGPVVPVLRAFGFIPPAEPITEPGELLVYEAFLATFSAAVFWVFICPVIVWLLAAICLKLPARHTPRPLDA